MTSSEIEAVLSSTLADRWLLGHPFYLRWEAGELSMPELSAYAGQYRHFEAYLPGFLERLAGSLPAGEARDMVVANLADERGDPVPHAELFERFAAAVGADADAPSPAMSALLGTYDELLGESPVAALAGFLAYESQAADVARSKGEGLRRHYGLDDQAASFWEHHAEVDARHRDWTERALAVAMDSQRVRSAFRRAADAWWAFLDERESLARTQAA